MSALNILLIIEFCIFLAVMMVTNFDIISPGVVAISVSFIATLLLKFVEDSWMIILDLYEVLILSLGLCTILFTEILTTRIRNPKKSRYRNVVEKRVNLKKYTPVRMTLPTKKQRIRKDRSICSLSEEQVVLKINTPVRIVFIALCLILLGAYIIEIYKKGVGLGGRGLLSIGIVANSMSDGTERLSIIGKIAYQYNSLIAYPFCWVFVKELSNQRNFKENFVNLVPVLCCLTTHFFGANRHNIFRIILAMIFCGIVVIRQNRSIKKNDKRKFAVRSVTIFALFLFVFYLIKDVVKVSTHSISFFEYIIYYLSSSIVLFGNYLVYPFAVRPPSQLFGETCFTGFYSTLMRWGFLDSVTTETNHSIIGGVSGIRTGNTYTFFMRPYHDFGVSGVVIITFIIFFIACYLYHKHIERKATSLKSYKKRMMIIIFMSYFYYMFPLAISDFYLTIESKTMTLVYLLSIYLICKMMFRACIVDSVRVKRGDNEDKAF